MIEKTKHLLVKKRTIQYIIKLFPMKHISIWSDSTKYLFADRFPVFGADQKENRFGKTGRRKTEQSVEPIRLGSSEHRCDVRMRGVRVGWRSGQIDCRSGCSFVLHHRGRSVGVFRWVRVRLLERKILDSGHKACKVIEKNSK